ncbi:MAG: DUF1800 family protein [Burkholderiaceae bacterium]
MLPLIRLFVLATLAATPLLQAAPAMLDAAAARHLLVRTGFAPTQQEVDALTGQSAQRAVGELLVRAQAAKPRQPPPAFVSQPPPGRIADLKDRDAIIAARREQLREGLELKNWWLGEMLTTPTPLAERMTLFWHNHFATSQQKVVRSQVMWQQHQLLRTNALGNFRTLLHAVAKDPALLVYLDAANSRKDAPNENFAREVMELFTLGEATQGQGATAAYSERDVKEVARALTGWSIDRDTFTFKFRPFFHDSGSKTVLGRTGNFDGDAVLDVLLDQPTAARFITTKLWREFVSPQPQPQAAERIAARFKQSGWDISVVMRELLLCDEFWAEANRGSLIKSPVDLVVGTVRQFGFVSPNTLPFTLKTAQLGQNLLVPPNVKGWPGQNDWINSTTLLGRKQFTEQLLKATPDTLAAREGMMRRMKEEFASGGGRGSPQQAVAMLGKEGALLLADSIAKTNFDAAAWLAAYGAKPDSVPSDDAQTRMAQALLAVPPTQTIAAGTVGLAYLRGLTQDPAYQLK